MPRKKKTRGRRANGEGSLYQRSSDGLWIYEITFPGESKPRYFSGKTAEKAIEKKDEALKTLYVNGFLPKKNKTTVGEWLDFWLTNYKIADLTDTGRESYENEIKYRIKPHLGNILLSELRPLDIQQWINKLSTEGRKDGKGGLAPKTVVRSFGVLRQALDKAVEQELIISNPAAKKTGKNQINLPKVPKPQIKHMTVDDTAAFLQAIKDDYMYPAIVTGLMTGLRRGELLGLKWKDIDLKKGTILVRRQLVRKASGECKLEERVKTDTGFRELQSPPELITILKKHKQQQWEQKQNLRGDTKVIDIKSKEKTKKSRNDPQAEDLVFCWPDGRWYAPDHFYRHLQRLLNKHGFERLSVHGLRHTYATSAVALGIDISVLSQNLGHADIATTTIYLHSDKDREKAAAEKIANAFLKH